MKTWGKRWQSERRQGVLAGEGEGHCASASGALLAHVPW